MSPFHGAKDDAGKTGNLKVRFGLGWAKSHRFYTGQTPVLKYNRQLMQAILHDRLPIAKIVNATVISLNDAPKGYADFDSGVAKKSRSRSQRTAEEDGLKVSA